MPIKNKISWLKPMTLTATVFFLAGHPAFGADVRWGPVGKKGKELRGIHFDTGTARYSLALYGPGFAPVEGNEFELAGCGLWPSRGGWAATDFVTLKVNDQPLLPSMCKVRFIEQGTRKGVALDLDHAAGRATLEFTVEDGGNRLFLEIKLAGQGKSSGWSISSLCHPGYEVSDQGSATANRSFLTATRRFENAKDGNIRKKTSVDLDPKAEAWVFLFDDTLDPGVKKEYASSGLLYNPAEVAAATVDLGYNKSVRVQLDYPGTVTTAHLIYWEFTNVSNQQAGATFQNIKVGTPPQ